MSNTCLPKQKILKALLRRILGQAISNKPTGKSLPLIFQTGEQLLLESQLLWGKEDPMAVNRRADSKSNQQQILLSTKESNDQNLSGAWASVPQDSLAHVEPLIYRIQSSSSERGTTTKNRHMPPFCLECALLCLVISMRFAVSYHSYHFQHQFHNSRWVTWQFVFFYKMSLWDDMVTGHSSYPRSWRVTTDWLKYL